MNMHILIVHAARIQMNVEFISNCILFSLFVFNILLNNAIEKRRFWFLANLQYFFL